MRNIFLYYTPLNKSLQSRFTRLAELQSSKENSQSVEPSSTPENTANLLPSSAGDLQLSLYWLEQQKSKDFLAAYLQRENMELSPGKL
jgi:hypothetical protein